MSETAADPRFSGPTPPARRMRPTWSDPRFRAIIWQVLFVGGVVFILWRLAGNASANLAARHIATGFAFLWRNAGFPIAEPLLPYDPAVNSYGYALLLGILNTLRVAVVGIVFATILGTLIGIARLSPNWLLSRLALVYVEALRDTPLLLQLLFWYSLLHGLPGPRQAINPLPGVFLSNRGIKMPVLAWATAHWWVLGALLLGAAGTVAWSVVARRRQEATGKHPAVWPVGIGLMLAFPAAVWVAIRAPWAWDVPALRGFNFQGGMTLSPEYAALTLGLILYTSAYIAEIVRAGLLAVAQGQWEAAAALGLHRGAVLRLIVLPQSLRVIIPPLTSQYLNLTKNSSLAVAIGYQDIVSMAETTLNQTGQSIEGIALVMAVYLTISLSISLFMNWYNRRMALKER